MTLFIQWTHFLIGIIVVFGQDEFGTENGGGEYQNIFKNIPTLFEYMLETLEEKPEVLEKNDANVFRADEDREVPENIVRFQRSASENEVESKEVEKTKVIDDNTNRPTNTNNKLNKEKSHELRPYDVNTHNNDDNVINDKRESIRKESEDTMKIESISKEENKRKTVKRSSTSDSNTKSDDEEEISAKDIGSFEGNDGKDTTRSLTPEEVAQQALKVEQMLEHHNTSKK